MVLNKEHVYNRLYLLYYYHPFVYREQSIAYMSVYGHVMEPAFTAMLHGERHQSICVGAQDIWGDTLAA